MLKMKYKKASVMSIVILVFLVVLLISSTLFYFFTKSVNVSKDLVPSTEINRVYERERFINFYIQDWLDRFSKGVEDKTDFILEAKRGLSFYKTNEGVYFVPEYLQLENQLDKVEIVYDSKEKPDKIKINFDIVIEDSFKSEGKEAFSVEYKYTKDFTSDV